MKIEISTESTSINQLHTSLGMGVELMKAIAETISDDDLQAYYDRQIANLKMIQASLMLAQCKAAKEQREGRANITRQCGECNSPKNDHAWGCPNVM